MLLENKLSCLSNIQINNTINYEKDNKTNLSNIIISLKRSEYESDYEITINDIKYEYFPIYQNSINGYTLYGDIHKMEKKFS